MQLMAENGEIKPVICLKRTRYIVLPTPTKAAFIARMLRQVLVGGGGRGKDQFAK